MARRLAVRRTTLTLPTVDHTRTEFGKSRSKCSCPECTAYCKFLPGYLIPSDLGRMLAVVGLTEQDEGSQVFTEYIKANLRASPGAVVLNSATGGTRRIPTLVPARKEDGSCVHLDDKGHCQVHAVAPFGCAFFDHTTASNSRDDVSILGLRAIAADHQTGGLYHRLWVLLDEQGLCAPDPALGRRDLVSYLEDRKHWWKRVK